MGFFAEYAEFAARLHDHNTREWFDEHRAEYQVLRLRWLVLVENILAQVHEMDPEIGLISPKECVFRIYRDTRFSRNKTPYKTHLSAVFVRGRELSGRPGYYIEMDHEGRMQIGGGLWMPQGEVLKNVREYLSVHGKRLTKILKNPAFKEYYGGLEPYTLKTAPRGWPKDAPFIEYVRHTSWIVTDRVGVMELTDEAAVELIIQRFAAFLPLKSLLTTAVQGK
jgi:uncharacterized protein (TIGR02453 family)